MARGLCDQSGFSVMHSLTPNKCIFSWLLDSDLPEPLPQKLIEANIANMFIKSIEALRKEIVLKISTNLIS